MLRAFLVRETFPPVCAKAPLTISLRLLHRAWLTLWKPVPDLINILGVEVPDTPAVSLAGIKADAITLHWTRPGPNKPVLKYHIQVNGVNGKIWNHAGARIVLIIHSGRVITVGDCDYGYRTQTRTLLQR